MSVRPAISEETDKRLNEKLDNVMRVDPETVGFDTRLNILLDEFEEAKKAQFASQPADNRSQF